MVVRLLTEIMPGVLEVLLDMTVTPAGREGAVQAGIGPRQGDVTDTALWGRYL